MLLIWSALALSITHAHAFMLSPQGTTSIQRQQACSRSEPLVLLAKKDGWSIGKSRKQGKTSREKTAKPQGRGFGTPAASQEPPREKAQAAADEAAAATGALLPSSRIIRTLLAARELMESV